MNGLAELGEEAAIEALRDAPVPLVRAAIEAFQGNEEVAAAAARRLDVLADRGELGVAAFEAVVVLLRRFQTIRIQQYGFQAAAKLLQFCPDIGIACELVEVALQAMDARIRREAPLVSACVHFLAAATDPKQGMMHVSSC